MSSNSIQSEYSINFPCKRLCPDGGSSSIVILSASPIATSSYQHPSACNPIYPIFPAEAVSHLISPHMAAATPSLSNTTFQPISAHSPALSSSQVIAVASQTFPPLPQMTPLTAAQPSLALSPPNPIDLAPFQLYLNLYGDKNEARFDDLFDMFLGNHPQFKDSYFEVFANRMLEKFPDCTSSQFCNAFQQRIERLTKSLEKSSGCISSNASFQSTTPSLLALLTQGQLLSLPPHFPGHTGTSSSSPISLTGIARNSTSSSSLSSAQHLPEQLLMQACTDESTSSNSSAEPSSEAQEQGQASSTTSSSNSSFFQNTVSSSSSSSGSTSTVAGLSQAPKRSQKRSRHISFIPENFCALNTMDQFNWDQILPQGTKVCKHNKPNAPLEIQKITTESNQAMIQVSNEAHSMEDMIPHFTKDHYYLLLDDKEYGLVQYTDERASHPEGAHLSNGEYQFLAYDVDISQDPLTFQSTGRTARISGYNRLSRFRMPLCIPVTQQTLRIAIKEIQEKTSIPFASSRFFQRKRVANKRRLSETTIPDLAPPPQPNSSNSSSSSSSLSPSGGIPLGLLNALNPYLLDPAYSTPRAFEPFSPIVDQPPSDP